MSAANLKLVEASTQTHSSRSEQYGTDAQGHPIIAQVVAAAEHVRTYDGVQNLTLTGSSQALTPQGASTHCEIYAEGASDTDFCRYWVGGTAPTSSVGKRLKDHEEIACATPNTFHAINSSGTVTLRIEYYHYA